ncbi:MAG: hypothetical protein ACEPOZ_10750 [Marinifilaceae bacterium]
MIKIEHPNLSQIVSQHTEACVEYVTPRLNFCIALFDALGNKNYSPITQSVQKTIGIEAATAKAIVKPFIKKRKKNIAIGEIKSAICSKNNHIFVTSSKINRYKALYKFFSEVKVSLSSIIAGEPEELFSIVTNSIFQLQSDDQVKHCLELIFNYDAFVKTGFDQVNGTIWNNYSLTQVLDLSVCPYCNRSWVVTVENNGSKLTNPQLDHFFSKTDYPLLRLSFYNLIPSCETCNSRLKGAVEFSIQNNLHPYIEGYGEEGKFHSIAYDYESAIGIASNYEIFLETADPLRSEKNDRIRENHKVFKIDEIYNSHGDIVSELYRKKSNSNDKYLEILANQFPAANLTKGELYRMAFGNYYKENDFKKRPFAKLTKDIAEQLNLIVK